MAGVQNENMDSVLEMENSGGVLHSEHKIPFGYGRDARQTEKTRHMEIEMGG